MGRGVMGRWVVGLGVTGGTYGVGAGVGLWVTCESKT